jgi:hypothetical protein
MTMRVPRATSEYLRARLDISDTASAVQDALHYWSGTAFRFGSHREPTDEELQEMEESLSDLAEEILDE